jgi:hypothetical protein
MTTLKDQAKKKNASKSETPVVIYIAVGIGAVIAFVIRWFDKDFSLNILSEIIGAAFTLLVIDVLLVKSKTKRWLIVQAHIDYLIGRTVNRIRDGIATRIFSFKPELGLRMREDQALESIRFQREKLLNDLSLRSPEKIAEKIDPGFFNEESYDYFDEKAEDIWKLVNMKYAEYLAPELVSLLIDLHTNMVDLCAQIRAYAKSERFPDEKEYYQTTALIGSARNLKEIIRIVIRLKEEGYSEVARIIT